MVQKLKIPLDALCGYYKYHVGKVNSLIFLEWDKIVGCKWELETVPLNIVYKRRSYKYGVLHVGVYNSSMALTLQYMIPNILNRIKNHIGYKLIEDIKIIQL